MAIFIELTEGKAWECQWKMHLSHSSIFQEERLYSLNTAQLFIFFPGEAEQNSWLENLLPLRSKLTFCCLIGENKCFLFKHFFTSWHNVKLYDQRVLERPAEGRNWPWFWSGSLSRFLTVGSSLQLCHSLLQYKLPLKHSFLQHLATVLSPFLTTSETSQQRSSNNMCLYSSQVSTPSTLFISLHMRTGGLMQGSTNLCPTKLPGAVLAQALHRQVLGSCRERSLQLQIPVVSTVVPQTPSTCLSIRLCSPNCLINMNHIWAWVNW